MAYNSYFPQFYQGVAQPQMPLMNAQAMQASTPTGNNSIVWVQGVAAAKAYPVGAGQSVLLMDSEESVFYIKSSDQSGMPQPIRTFEYTERVSENVGAGPLAKEPTDEFVSRKEFDEFKEDVKRSIKGIRKPRVGEEGDE